ncbi:MAG: universal stress protein [Comamonadaceae bacterium]|nr:MAG: universal stress protein [Comamonadaceae bacterium]
MHKRIMIVVNDQASCQCAITQGIEMARVHRAEVVFLYVLPNYEYPEMNSIGVLSPDQFIRDAREVASRVLQAASVQAENSEVFSVSVVGTTEHPAVYVAEEADKRRCSLIVVATEGRNAVMRLLTGSIVPGLITNASVPVMVCPQET